MRPVFDACSLVSVAVDNRPAEPFHQSSGGLVAIEVGCDHAFFQNDPSLIAVYTFSDDDDPWHRRFSFPVVELRARLQQAVADCYGCWAPFPMIALRCLRCAIAEHRRRRAAAWPVPEVSGRR